MRSACEDGSDRWVEAAFEELVLPERDADEPRYQLRLLDESNKVVRLAASSMRPMWNLNQATSGWSLANRRSGPCGAALLTVRRADDGAWSLDQQVNLSGPEPIFSDGGAPTKIEKAAAKAAADPSAVPILLLQEDGAWKFGGDGSSSSFQPPLAPLPKDENPPLKFSRGEKVEVGALDEGYVGSWYAAEIIATSGGEPGHVQIRFDTLQDDDGTALTEWQPRACLRPRPPSMLPDCFPPDHFAEGDPLQLWFNDGWWECIVVPKPNTSKREIKARFLREKAHQEAVAAAEAAGEEPPELPAGLGGDITVKFLHYPEIHPNIGASQVRPAWVTRNGEWFWRISGGVLQYLTNRMADGKTSRDGMVKPMWKKTFVPSGVPINVRDPRMDPAPPCRPSSPLYPRHRPRLLVVCCSVRRTVVGPLRMLSV